jgi:hypothetical protein
MYPPQGQEHAPPPYHRVYPAEAHPAYEPLQRPVYQNPSAFNMQYPNQNHQCKGTPQINQIIAMNTTIIKITIQQAMETTITRALTKIEQRKITETKFLTLGNTWRCLMRIRPCLSVFEVDVGMFKVQHGFSLWLLTLQPWPGRGCLSVNASIFQCSTVLSHYFSDVVTQAHLLDKTCC